jgi:hypothetical protein
VVLRNLVDPIKSQDVKYRTLKLDNAKLHQKLFSITYMRDLLGVLGFCESTNADGVSCLMMEDQKVASSQTQTTVTGCLEELVQTQENLTTEPTNKKPKVQSQSQAQSMAVDEQPAKVFYHGDLDKLSEKQKARRMLAEKEKLDKVKAKEHRKKNLALLKADKVTRETDPNWKPGVSAACAKSGTGISTFRDKYGETDE